MVRRLDDLFVLLAGVLGVVVFWSTALAEAAGFCLLVVGALRAAAALRGKEPLLPSRAARIALPLWLAYTAALLASVIASSGSFLASAGLLWHPLLFPAALSVRIHGPHLRKAGTLLFVSGASAALVTVIVNLARNAPGPPFTFTGLTTLADLLVLAGIIALSTLLPGPGAGRRNLAVVVPGLVIPAVLVWSGERAPALALGAVGSIFIASAGPRPLMAWLLIAGACVLLGPRGLTDKMEWLIEGRPVDRYVVWEDAIRQIPRTPLLGYGPGSFAEVLPRESWAKFINRPPSSWHNDFLETWLDSGPIAALAFAGILLTGVAEGAASTVRRREDGKRSLRVGPGLLFLCLVSFGLVGSVVTTSVLGIVFWVLLGLTLNSHCVYKKECQEKNE